MMNWATISFLTAILFCISTSANAEDADWVSVIKEQPDCKYYADHRVCTTTDWMIDDKSIVAASDARRLIVRMKELRTNESQGFEINSSPTKWLGVPKRYETAVASFLNFDCDGFRSQITRKEEYWNGELLKLSLYDDQLPRDEVYKKGIMVSRQIHRDSHLVDVDVSDGPLLRVFSYTCESEKGKRVLSQGLSVSATGSVPIVKSGGTYSVKVNINGAIEIPFVIDSGASRVSIPFDVFSVLRRTGAIGSKDLKEKVRLSLANGSIVTGQVIVIQSIQLGSRIFRNIEVIVLPESDAPALLGQTILRKIEPWNIDTKRSRLIFQ